MYRKKTIHPSAMGGTDEAEYMYGGKRKMRKKAKKGGKVGKRAGMGIKAKAPGITTDKKHSWGKGHKF